MRIAIKPVIQDFELDFRVPDEPDARCHVAIRQARTGEQVRIGNLFADQTQIWDDESFGTVQLKRKWNPEELKQFRAYLTLVGCDLEDEDGSPIFQFRETKNGPELSMSQNSFYAAWGKLPAELTDEIHRKILKVNPQWDFSGAAGE